MTASPDHDHALAHAPVAVPLPPRPSTDWLPQESWEMLWRLADAVLPSIAASESSSSNTTGRDGDHQVVLSEAHLDEAVARALGGLDAPPGRDEVRGFLGQRVSRDPEFRRDVEAVLALSPQRDKLAGALRLLRSRIGSLLMGYCWTPLDRQPVDVLEAVLGSWRTSATQMPRMLLKTITTIVQKANAVTNPHLHRITGYPSAPAAWKPVASPDYRFVQVPPGPGPYTIETDVVVVGSGPGGGVTARNLAEAGHRVLVVDKAYHFATAQLPMPQPAALAHLFDSGGSYMSEDASLSTIAASAWGGGGTVNWSVSLPTPDRVRREWAEDRGLPVFATPAFDAHLDRVAALIGAGTDGIRHNHANRALLAGCAALGWRCRAAPQNTAGREHDCGHCHLGCGSGVKRGPAVSMLPAAADAGALFMEGFAVERVVFDGGDEEGGGRRAVGVRGLWTSRGPGGEVHTPASERVRREVVVKASKVVIAGGSLWSPVLLQKSGLQNPHIGRNLHLHPVHTIVGVLKHETRPWEGGIITSYSDEFADLDGDGYGVTLEPICMVPIMHLAQQPWEGGLDAKLWQLRFAHMAGYISLTRDRDGGRVFADPETGRPRVDYSASDHDRAHTLEGLRALAKVCYVAGATEIRTTIMGLGPFVRAGGGGGGEEGESADSSSSSSSSKDPEDHDPSFAAWLLRLRQIGNAPPVGTYGSAHQMSSCRMSGDEGSGVVDAEGRVWGTEGLYVADSSVLPTATGVNPMLSTLAVADMISQRLARGLDGQQGHEGDGRSGGQDA